MSDSGGTTSQTIRPESAHSAGSDGGELLVSALRVIFNVLALALLLAPLWGVWLTSQAIVRVAGWSDVAGLVLLLPVLTAWVVLIFVVSAWVEQLDVPEWVPTIAAAPVYLAGYIPPVLFLMGKWS